MAFNPSEVANPAHNIILDDDDVAYYTDALGNKVPAAVAVVPTASNTLTAFQGAGTVSAAHVEVHPASTIEEKSRPPFFVTAGGQKLPMIALMSFDAGNNLVPPGAPLPGNYQNVVYHPANPYMVEATDSFIVENIDNQVTNLPAATGSGRSIEFVIQPPSTVLNIYPQAGDQIDALTVGSQYQLWAAAESIRLTDAAAGHWVSSS